MSRLVSRSSARVSLCILVLLALGSCRHTAAPADTTPVADRAAIEAELDALNHRLTAAYEANDVATLEAMLAPEHIHNNVFGMALDKDTFLQDIRSGTLVFSRYETTSIRWHVYDDVAIATGTIEATAHRSGKQVPSSRFLFTRIFVRKDDAWQVLLFHNTIIGSRGAGPE